MIQGMHLQDFITKANGSGFVAGEDRMVFGFVEEIALETDKVRGEEDVRTKGGKKSIEIRGGGGGELGEAA